MSTLLLLIFTCFFTFLTSLEVKEGLVGVALIYRHGDRTPIETYPKDPYKNASYWPVGFGELTNIGKLQQFELGQWFRSRYGDFLPNQYSKKEVYVQSTDVDRTLMSAQTNLAGLFPPQGKEIWNENLAWQPIPVHTIPENEDNILRMKMPCEKYTYLFDQLLKSREFVEINNKNHELYIYLTEHSGELVNNIKGIEHLYSTFTIERLYNYTLPEWTNSVFPDKMSPWAHLSFALKCYTPELARLKAGPILNHILENFLKIRKHKGYKFVTYSAHDTTIANILMALNLFDYHSPPYAATIFLELRYLNDSYFVNLLYKNSSVPQELTLKGCEFLCPLDKFKNLLKPLLITPQQWKDGCILTKNFFSYAALSSTSFFIFSFILLFVGSCVLSMCFRDKKLRYDYTALPD